MILLAKLSELSSDHHRPRSHANLYGPTLLILPGIGALSRFAQSSRYAAHPSHQTLGLRLSRTQLNSDGVESWWSFARETHFLSSSAASPGHFQNPAELGYHTEGVFSSMGNGTAISRLCALVTVCHQCRSSQFALDVHERKRGCCSNGH